MTTNIRTYSSITRVPEHFRPTLYKLTLGRRGYMLLSARVLMGWRIKSPVVVAYAKGCPVGWMLLDPIDTTKLHMYVAKPYRRKGLARRMAIALKTKYPKLRLGVYPQGASAKVIKGLVKRRTDQ